MHAGKPLVHIKSLKSKTFVDVVIWFEEKIEGCEKKGLWVGEFVDKFDGIILFPFLLSLTIV